jgi:hypothetical protein
MKFREAVYRPHPPIEMIDRRTSKRVTFQLTNGCRLLLLRLADDMSEKGIVSVPRSVLAEHLAVAPARITEWIRTAIVFGLLSSVRRGQPGVTAVYQGLVPKELVRQGVPSERYARADQAEVRHRVPSENPERYALGGSHEETGPQTADQAPKFTVCTQQHDHANGSCETWANAARSGAESA